MTYEEAYEYLRRLMGCESKHAEDCLCKEDCNECEYDYESDDWEDAIATAKEALEKQIPIKAEYHAPDFDVRMFSWWTCGNCDCEIASVVDKYCSYCGKRIDWREDAEYEAYQDEMGGMAEVIEIESEVE